MYICHYCPPQRAVEDILLYIGRSLDMCTNKSKGIVLAGDFNCNMLKDCGRAQDLPEGTTDLGLSLEGPLAHPTYFAPNGQSSVDLIFSNAAAPSALVTSVEVARSALRKNGCIWFNISCAGGVRPPQLQNKQVERKTSPVHRSLLLSATPRNCSVEALDASLK